ncbi:MAG: hypothetical protein DRO23_05775 [Thermoprotei archaeon]|nr:MAG: hypothetical protein DRO23_05775 [Thermoprotei archaeon]
MNLKKLIILPIFLVLISSISIAFAMWSETLKVNVTVNTGEVDAEIVRIYTGDEVPPPGIKDYNGTPDTWPTCENFSYTGEGWVAVISGDLYWVQLDKDYAWATAWTVDSDGDGDNDTAYVKIHNGYPGYMVWFSLEVDNVGTIPIFIDYYVVNGTILTKDEIETNDLVFLDADGDCKPEVLIQLYNLLGVQMDPGDGLESSWRIVVLQPASENSEYVISVKLVAVQWNESIYYEE